MKRIIIASILLLTTIAANAQRVTGQFGAYYQSRFKAADGLEMSLSHWGVFAGAQFEPFYPWPVYLETGLGVSMCVGTDFKAHVYRLELPLDITWQWEPAPKFSVGPYAGAYATYNLKVFDEYGPKEELNPWGWGLMGGLSIRPAAAIINVGYYRDMMPLRKADAVLTDFFRPGHGIRISFCWCF
ncbi:MAG: hypothetical protein IJU21_03800 [Bacteroidales bacterium]|nr:hypothetical protein [Bacteroidales bacterium]